MRSPGPSPIGGEYIVLAPGAKYGSAKRWTGFGALADALARDGRRVIILGAAGEDVLDAPAHTLIENRVGRTSMEEAIAIASLVLPEPLIPPMRMRPFSCSRSAS